MTRLPLSLSLAALLLASTALPAQSADPALAWASIKELQQRMDAGQLRSEALARLFLERIQRIDRDGPALRAVLETNPDALKLAAQIDRQKPKGALRGIPVLLKDNIDTGDRMLTTAGSLALADAPPAPRDAGLVARLRKNGALILGKTNLSEWANMRSNHASSGWSARGGQTRNPYALDRNP